MDTMFNVYIKSYIYEGSHFNGACESEVKCQDLFQIVELHSHEVNINHKIMIKVTIDHCHSLDSINGLSIS